MCPVARNEGDYSVLLADADGVIVSICPAFRRTTLGIDNLIFISILTYSMSKKPRQKVVLRYW